VRAAFYELFVEGVGVCDVEVANKHKVARRPCAFAEERMAKRLVVVSAACAVAQMPD